MDLWRQGDSTGVVPVNDWMWACELVVGLLGGMGSSNSYSLPAGSFTPPSVVGLGLVRLLSAPMSDTLHVESVVGR